MPLERLTREQYDSAVFDLLGIGDHPARALAPDEKLAAFDNNSVSPISRLVAEQYRDVAEGLAQRAVTERLDALVSCATRDQPCAEQFIDGFGKRAFRRPLTPEERARYVVMFTAGQTSGFADGISLVIEGILQSPSFLYRLELTPAQAGSPVTQLDGYELATRLSFALWNSLPDAALLDAAAQGQLASVEGLRTQADRLLESERARGALSSFHLQWLGLDTLLDRGKEPQLFPEYSSTLRQAMQDEVTDFADFVIRRGDGKLATLLSAPFTRTSSPELLSLYGATAAPQADGSVPLDPGQRAGLLTQAAFLSAHSHPNQTSPVQRGKFVRTNLLCQDLPSPPPNVNSTPPEPDPTATTRQRFEQHRADPSCAACHRLIDPIGVGFESYDAIGRFRSTENGTAIDATGELADAGDASGNFDGAVQLGQRLASSTALRDCVQKQWFRFSLGRFEGADDTCTLASVGAAFEASGYDMKQLLLSLVTSNAFRYRKVEP